MAAPADDPETEIGPTLPAVTASSTTKIQCKTESTEANNDDDNNDASNVDLTAAKEEKRGIYASYQHSSCLRRIKFAFQRHPNVKTLLESLNKLGSEFDIEKQVTCEKCTTETNINGGFDPNRNEILVCENRSPTQRLTSMLLTHELVHAYDHTKSQVDWTDLKAVACSEIRAANLSGDCSFLSEKFYRGNIGAKFNHEACVKRLAVASIIATRDVSKEEAGKIADGVWDDCYSDYAPFPAHPHRDSESRFSRFSKYYQPR
ncbi:mitochondrial inner membrane protease ATP23 homolog [Asterias amurensis]|uniref:mitochondrial inner membrane protease ATP23 homolog n=1 Tax=Asterias amurensis TaxID=7602 RepID=UPI003AB3AC6A